MSKAYVPHEYQAYCIDRIINQDKLGLFLDMGLGKTVITLTAVAKLMYEQFAVRKALIIAPKNVANKTWTDEIAKWQHLSHLRAVICTGPAKKRQTAVLSDADIYIINRENVAWLVKFIGHAWPFDMVIIDELSSFKGHDSVRFKNLAKLVPFHTKRVVGLTGTPAPNGYIDLWAQVFLLDGGQRLGQNITAYRNNYFSSVVKDNIPIKYTANKAAQKEIDAKLAEICVSMQSADYIQLPERIDIVREAEFTPEQMREYKQLEREAYLQMLDTEITAFNAAALSNKLLQCANGAVYDEDRAVHEFSSAKLEVLEDLIEAAVGKPLLVFYSYKHDLSRITNRFPEAVVFTGAEQDAWNRGEIPILLAHPKSAGHGLNMQAGGNQIVWFGLSWSLEEYMQANARLHRQGQKDTVTVHHILTRGTRDYTVYEALRGKNDTQAALLESLKREYGGKQNG